MQLIHNKHESDANLQASSFHVFGCLRKGKGGKRKQRDNHAPCMCLDAQGKIEGNEPKRWNTTIKNSK
jgi:hypothetical protein